MNTRKLPKNISRLLEGRIRTLSFDGNIHDPYVIGHHDENELCGDRLRQLLHQYASKSGGMPPSNGEEFSEFLEWLCDNYGYHVFAVSDAMCFL